MAGFSYSTDHYHGNVFSLSLEIQVEPDNAKSFQKAEFIYFSSQQDDNSKWNLLLHVKGTVQSSLIQVEDDEHSPNGEVSNRSKKLCQMIKNLLGTVLGNIGHGIGPTFPSTAPPSRAVRSKEDNDI